MGSPFFSGSNRQGASYEPASEQRTGRGRSAVRAHEIDEGQAGPAVCSGCSKPLDTTYYEANGKLVCEGCCCADAGGPRRRLAAMAFHPRACSAHPALIARRWCGAGCAGPPATRSASLPSWSGSSSGWPSGRARAGAAASSISSWAQFLTYFSICTTYVPMLLADIKEHAREIASSQPALAVTTAPGSQPGEIALVLKPETQPAGLGPRDAGALTGGRASSQTASEGTGGTGQHHPSCRAGGCRQTPAIQARSRPPLTI